MDRYCVVKTSIANLYKNPSFKSELVTQALNLEKLLIIEQDANWYKIRQWDNYESWIHSFYVSLDIESNSDDNNNEIIKFSDQNLISKAKEFLDTPYLWGGKSKLGFDCSGFIQTVFKSFGINFPRDSYEQMDFKDLIEIEYSEIEIGDLLFFADNKNVNHVAICIGNEEIIHSSGCVKIEKLEDNKELYKKLYKVMSIKKIFKNE